MVSTSKKISHKKKNSALLIKRLLKIAGFLSPTQTGNFIAQKFLTPRKFRRPKWESELLTDAELKTLPSERKIWIWGKGPGVLLVHGWEGRGTQLGSMISPLVKNGYRVIAWDGPAHGDSPGKQTHLPNFAKALAEDLPAMGVVDAVIAHSMGGPATLIAMERYSSIKKTIFIASPSQWMGAVNMVANKLELSELTKNALIKSLNHLVGEAIENFDVHKRKPSANFEMLLIHSKEDSDVPYTEMLRINQAFPHAKTATFEGLGHRRILKDAGVIEHIMNFISAAPIRHSPL